VERPADFFEALIQPWPVSWGYVLLALVAVSGIFCARWRKTTPKWAPGLLLAWLAWQFVSATQTTDATLTQATLKHFVACAVCFFLGWLALSELRSLRLFWVGLALGFVWVIRAGIEQHFGGLEETRRYFFLYVYPQLAEVPEDYLKKISSDRIFSTLFYPNTLAAVILLLLPICLAAVWTESRGLSELPRRLLRVALAGLLGIGALGCLYWSGSKAGWLVMLLMIVVVLLHLPFGRWIKVGIIAGIVVVGLTGFFVRYAQFFERGATSVGARFDYWRAGVGIARENPIVGTGPGTFSVSYARVKKPESEMARLAHNEYREQACDSGVIGFLAYGGFILGSLAWIYGRRVRHGEWREATQRTLEFGVWLGLAAVAAQGFVEFNLYIPAVAWPTFTLLGWLWGISGSTSDQ
jgi:O-antigen ligase